MAFRIRPAHSGDFARIAAILTAIDPEPTSLEDVTEMYEAFPAEGIRQTWVGVDETDSPLSWGVASRIPTARPGKFRAFVATEPAARDQGIGTALADALEQFSREHGATMIETDVRETEAYSIRFAEGRGYKGRATAGSMSSTGPRCPISLGTTLLSISPTRTGGAGF